MFWVFKWLVFRCPLYICVLVNIGDLLYKYQTLSLVFEHLLKKSRTKQVKRASKPAKGSRQYLIGIFKLFFQGPVLVITFLSQQIMSVRDAKGVVVEGDPEKVLRVMYVWVLCRDQTELDPKAAWRLLELSANSTEQFL